MEMSGGTYMDNRLIRKFVWISVGVILGLMAALMVISGSGSLNEFYDGGRVCDIPVERRNAEFYGAEYDAAGEMFCVTDENAYKVFEIYGMEKKWNYIVMELSSLNREYLDVTIDYANQKGAWIFSKDVRLLEGKNVVETDEISYDQAVIRILGQAGATVSFDKVQFREKMVDFEDSRFLPVWTAVFLVYLAVTAAVTKWCRGFLDGMPDWYVVIELLQDIYGRVGEYFGKKTLPISDRGKSRVRTGGFLFLILYMQIVMDLHLYETDQYYKVQMLICSLVVVVIGVFCYEKKLRHVNWRNPLVWSWLVLWVMACMSDFFVAKRYSFLGYIMLSAVGFFIFMWNNMEQSACIIREFVAAILLSFAFTTVFCFVCRPWQEGTRYLGSYYNPGMYAMYVLYVWIAFWGEIDERAGRKKLSLLLFFEIIAAMLAGMMLWRTQSASGVIPAFLAVAVFVFRQFFLPGPSVRKKRALLILAFAVAVTVPVVKIGTWGLIHLPGRFGTEIKMESDTVLFTSQILPEPTTVYAAEENVAEEKGVRNNRIVQKLFGKQSFEKFTSRRNLYWAGYLREMNLLGHRGRVVLWGGNRWPHNGFLGIMFRYGVFAVIPYTVLVLVNFLYAWKYMLTCESGYGFFVFAGMIASLILILMENLELPFLFLCWLNMYLMMGIHFVQREKDSYE